MRNVARAVLGGFVILAAAIVYTADPNSGPAVPILVGVLGLLLGLSGCVGSD